MVLKRYRREIKPCKIEVYHLENRNKVFINKNFILIGFMGSGKTAVANFLKEHHHMAIIDTDQLIVEKEGLSIQEIFSEKGESYFRLLETKLLEELAWLNLTNTVISCGGGMVINPANVVKMREIGVVVYLSASPEAIYQRVKDDRERPLLNDNMNVEFISDLLSKRRGFYEEAADMKVETDCKSVVSVCQEILSKLEV